MFELSFEFGPELARHAFWRAAWQRQGGYLVAMPLLALLSLVGSVLRWQPWLCGLGVGVSMAYLYAMWFAARRVGQAAQARAQLPVRVVLAEGGCRLEQGSTGAELPWTEIDALSRLEQVWLLWPRTGERPIPLAARALGEEARGFLAERVRQAGGRVE